jgi:hypothetical protein
MCHEGNKMKNIYNKLSIFQSFFSGVTPATGNDLSGNEGDLGMLSFVLLPPLLLLIATDVLLV